MTWVPPSETRFGLLDYLEEGILLMPLRFGITSMRKMLAASKRNHEMIDQVTQGKPHQYLSMVAVHPKLQGRGIGRKMIERYLAVEIDCTDGKRLPVVLTTQLESNVRFYRHLGFEVRATHEVRVSGIRYTNWTMTRE
jgi:ribosomal protein S18 acetylase RimI-like enzyme